MKKNKGLFYLIALFSMQLYCMPIRAATIPITNVTNPAGNPYNISNVLNNELYLNAVGVSTASLAYAQSAAGLTFQNNVWSSAAADVNGGIFKSTYGSFNFGNSSVFNNNSITYSGTATTAYARGSVIYGINSQISFGDNSTFSNNKSTGYRNAEGGAIYADNSTLNIGINADFTNNSAVAANSTAQTQARGGAISVRNNSVLNIGDGASFTSNFVTALFSTTLGPPHDVGGGAVHIMDSQATFGNNITFTGNTTNGARLDAGGGAVNLARAAAVFGSNVQFIGNTANQSGNTGAASAYSDGGAISGRGPVSLTIGDNALFQNNKSLITGMTGSVFAYSGALHGYNGDVKYELGSGVTFDGNTAQATTIATSVVATNVNAVGGAIGVVDNESSASFLTFEDNITFKNNRAEAATTGATFTGNANARGGVFFNNISLNMTMGNTLLFENNFAKSGTAGGTSSTNGVATAQGGAIYSAQTGGAAGGTAVLNGLFNLGDAVFTGNYVEAIAQRTVANAYGGSIYAANSRDINFNGTASFTANNANGGKTVYAKGGTSVGTGAINTNAMAQGGFIYAGSANIFNFAGSAAFTGASVIAMAGNASAGTGTALATALGGAIYANGTSPFTFNDTASFSGNSASAYAGITSTTGTNATAGGGAIYSLTSDFTFNGNASFSGNSVFSKGITGTTGGGAVYNTGKTFFKGDASFSNNSITVEGISSMYASPVNLYGGGFYSTAQTEFQNSLLFDQNSISLSSLNYNQGTGSIAATVYGGAMYSTNGSTLWGAGGSSSFTGNSISVSGISSSTSAASANITAYGGALRDGVARTIGSTLNFSGNSISVAGTNAPLSTSSIVDVRGGALHSMALTLNNTSDFNDNTITASGGQSSGSTDITAYGGALYAGGLLSASGAANFLRNEINATGSTASTVSAHGGALYLNNFANQFNASVNFEDNKVSASGGALNNAHGGAIYHSSGTLSLLGGASFDGNEAINGYGGAIYQKAGTINLTSTGGNINFINNQAGDASQGNDIYVQAGTININGTSGDVTFGGGIASASSGTRAINKTNGGNLFINGDSSGFTGTFAATGGTTTVSASGKMFTGTNTVSNNALVNVYGDGIYYALNIAANGNLAHYNTSSNQEIIDASKIKFTSSGGTATLGSATADNANYLLNTKIGLNNTSANKVTFDHSNVRLGINDYKGISTYNTTYDFTNSNLELGRGTSLQNYEFDKFTTSNSELSFRLALNSGVLTSDTLKVNSATTDTIGLGVIEFFGGTDVGLNDTYTTTVLTGAGGLKFDSAATSTFATTAYEYDVSVDAARTGIIIDAARAASEFSLNAMNIISGARGFFFDFLEPGAQTYNIGADLDQTASGTFTVNGFSPLDPSNSILSGAIVDNTGALTGDNGSFFKLVAPTNLTIKSLTIQDAYSSTNGSVINSTNAGAVATVENAIVRNNTSGGQGGAIYNSGTLNLIGNVSFYGNKANNINNDIYNNDGTINISGLAADEVSLAGGVAGTGIINKTSSGNLLVNGDSSGFTGTFNSTAGTNTFNSGFFSGLSKISNSTVNLGSLATVASTAVIELGGGGILNTANSFTAGDNMIKSALSGNGTYNKTAGTLTVNGDNSGFTGIFNQTGGSTVVNNGGKMFSGTNNISNSTLQVTDNEIGYSANLGNNGVLRHYSTSTGQTDISNLLGISFTGSGASMLFDKDGSLTDNAVYKLVTKIDNGSANTVSFDNSILSLGTTDYTGATTYSVNNSIIDLTSDAIETFNFTNFSTNNSKLSFDLNFTIPSGGLGATELDSDTLKVTNGTGTIGIGQIKVVNDDDDGLHGSYTSQILDGLTFNNISDTATIATNVYEYAVLVNPLDRRFIELQVANVSNENSLNKMNIKNDERGFNLSTAGITYNSGASLDAMADGTFVVQGFSAATPGDSIFSGFLKQGGVVTTNRGSYFNIIGTTDFTLKNATFQDAYKTGNGSVLSLTGAASSAALSNLIIKNSEATGNGGAIYHTAGALNLTSVAFDNNKAVNGGTIYNGGGSDIAINGGVGFANTQNIVNAVNGGAVYNTGLGSDLEIKGTSADKILFTGLKAADGGAVYNTLSGSILTEYGVFDSNIASINGGSLHNSGGGSLNIGAGTVFKNTQNANLAVNGGAIYNAGSGSTANVSGASANNVEFSGLKAANGGAIYNDSGAAAVINGNTNFANNNASGNGGAIYNSGTLSLNTTDGNINFTGNTAAGLGRDIYNNNGTININGSSNALVFNGGIAGTGSINKSGAGSLTINSDETNFTGTFNSTGGTTTISSLGKMFGGANTVSGSGIVEVHGSAFDYNMAVGSTGIFKHYTTSTSTQNVGSSNGISLSGTGGSIVFDKDSSLAGNAKYNLTGKIDNNNANSVVFNNSDVTFSAVDYTGATTYGFNNSLIDLTSPANTVRDFVFDNLSTSNSDLNFGISFEKIGNSVNLVSDTLTVNNANTDSVNLGIIKILQDFGSVDNGLNGTYQTTVLSGIKFNPASVNQQIATTAYEYDAALVNGAGGQLTDLQLNVVKAADEDSLNAMNLYDGHRGFNFTFFDNQTQTYNIGSDLGVTAAGVFTVSGVNPSNSILSGAIIDNGVLTGDKGSLFKLNNNTQLTVQDLTVQDAYSSGNGSVLSLNNASASAALKNLVIENSSSDLDGGAIYNQSGTVSIIASTVSNITSGGLGGAVYNAGTLNLISQALNNDVIFANNADSSGANDIYNAGGTINVSGVLGTVSSSGGISGTGTINKSNAGRLELNGDNSGFSGTFNQSGGITVVTDKMFNGLHNLSGGIFDWENGASMSGDTSFAVGAGSILNINTDDNLDFNGVNIKKLGATSGTINKNGSGDLTVTGDYRGFTGDFNSAAGDITVSSGFFGGNTHIASGTLELADGSSLASTGSIDISTAVNMTTGGSITLHANQLQGSADFNKSDGILNINGSNALFTGTFTQTGGITNANNDFIFAESIIDNSVLNGAINTSANLTLNTGIWNMSGSSSLDSLTANSSDIIFSGATRKTLTLHDYNASSANIYLSTFLGGDGSPTDKIVINGGNLTGTSVLFINGYGSGAQTLNGIKIIEAQNGTTIASDAFSLNGGFIDVGGFTYRLFQGDVDGIDSQSWFLRSTGFSTITLGIAQEPSILINIMKAGMNSLSRRMGELRDADSHKQDGLWVRTYAKNLKLSEFIDTDMNIFGFEAGYDHKVYADRKNVVYVGAMAGHMSIDNIKSYSEGSSVNRGNGSAPSVGLYATWLNNNGWFADATYRTFWEDLNNNAYFSDGTSLSYEPNRQMNAFALEGGRQMMYQIDKCSKYIFEPKLKVMYARAEGKNIDNSRDASIRYGATESLTTKLSGMFGYNHRLDNGIVIEPYVQVSAVQEWQGKTDVTYDAAGLNSNLKGFSMEYGAGLNTKLDDTWSAYGDVMYEKGSVVESLSGNLGIRYNF